MAVAAKTKINPLGLKSSDIRKAMSDRWSDPEWAIMWEVGQGTGRNSGRYADAVMMSLWPSRGLELHGVEIKVSRSDWKREAADPAKAETIAQYCDRWWIHTPENVVDDLSDLPPAWGLREWTGKKWVTVREAEKTEAKPVPRSFLAAMLRRADGTMRGMIQEAKETARQELWGERERNQRQYHEQVRCEVERRTKEYADLQQKFDDFEAAFGAELAAGWGTDFAALGGAAKAVYEIRSKQYGGAEKISERLRDAASAIDEIRALAAGRPQ